MPGGGSNPRLYLTSSSMLHIPTSRPPTSAPYSFYSEQYSSSLPRPPPEIYLKDLGSWILWWQCEFFSWISDTMRWHLISCLSRWTVIEHQLSFSPIVRTFTCQVGGHHSQTHVRSAVVLSLALTTELFDTCRQKHIQPVPDSNPRRPGHRYSRSVRLRFRLVIQQKKHKQNTTHHVAWMEFPAGMCAEAMNNLNYDEFSIADIVCLLI